MFSCRLERRALEPDQEPPIPPDDPVPPKAALGDSGVRPDWLVTAEDGVGAEKARMSGLSGPPTIKPGVARIPPKTPPPAAPSLPMNPYAPTNDAPARMSTTSSSFYETSAEPAPARVPTEAAAEAPADDVPWVKSAATVPKKMSSLPSEFGIGADAPEPEIRVTSTGRLLDQPIAKIAIVAVALLVVVFIGVQLVPKKSQADSTRIAEIRKSPTAFDGRVVTVSGRVGEIFQIGPSWAYYLHDGKDAILIFTRKGSPESRTKQTVTGKISTGVLEGEAKTALFENG